MTPTPTPQPTDPERIDPKGFWKDDKYWTQAYDIDFIQGLVHSFQAYKDSDKSIYETLSINDYGCGAGLYVQSLSDLGFNIEGYDGNPLTDDIPGCCTCDLTDTAAVNEKVRSCHWGLCLEVGEHIPRIYLRQFIKNLYKKTKHGLILSWASPVSKGTDMSTLARQLMSKG